jgi:predicted phage baseplate assembly protein
VVQVLLVPALPSHRLRVSPEELRPTAELLDLVKQHLDQRRLLTTALIVSEPDYRWVSVAARVRVRWGVDAEVVRQNVEEKLYRFIHPLHGGPDGTGWPFGRDLFVSELYSQIQSVAGVEYTEQLNIFPVDLATGEQGEAIQTLTVPPTGLLCSHTHTVTCV